jgi:hypothetical protein
MVAGDEITVTMAVTSRATVSFAIAAMVTAAIATAATTVYGPGALAAAAIASVFVALSDNN